jgi:pimeloyl-ACP methyl ester carboxylesterase
VGDEDVVITRDDARARIDELRGVGKLAVDATKGITDLVELVHGAIGGAPARVVSAPVYFGIRGVATVVGCAIDRALVELAQLTGHGSPIGDGALWPERQAVIAAVNGVLGDYLAATSNPLAIQMRLHRMDATPPTGDMLVFVHGSSMDHHAWQAARHLGHTPVHLHYNSGLHVSANGRAFDASLDDLVAQWPVPVERIAIVAHSMGGLVARSACHYAEERRHAWRERLRAIVFLGTPHHGAPLERLGNLLETFLGVTRYSAPFARLGKIRSAGVTDLRFGNVVDEHWDGRDRFAIGADARTPVPLPRGVECYAVAAADDALVPVSSAMGEHPAATMRLDFPAAHRFLAKDTGHVALLHRPEVWDQIERWLVASGPER